MATSRGRTEPAAFIPSSAAGWIARTQSRDLTPEERKAFGHWFRFSKKNSKAYLQADVIWRMSGWLQRYPEVAAELLRLQKERDDNVIYLIL